MSNTQNNQTELKQKFWRNLSTSPFVFLQRNDDPRSAVPMTAQLDKEADGAIWFFTTKDSDLAKLGDVTATFMAKGHDLFARFEGRLQVETDQGKFEQFWNNFVKAWYDGGKEDPNLLFLRMDLGDAEIWNGDLSLATTAKMMLGKNVREDVQDKQLETTL